MSARPDILCIGSVLWDVIGRCDRRWSRATTRPGRITRLPGGVALNIAMTLRRFDLTPALLTVVGDDPEGRDLLAECGRMGLLTEHVVVAGDLPTDRYMAIEAAGGLIAAIADAHSLERVGGRILAPLLMGGWRPAAPYPGAIAIDGNLTEALLAEIGASPPLPPPTCASFRRAPARRSGCAPPEPSARDALRQSRGGRADHRHGPAPRRARGGGASVRGGAAGGRDRRPGRGGGCIARRSRGRHAARRSRRGASPARATRSWPPISPRNWPGGPPTRRWRARWRPPPATFPETDHA
jgi:hypothetical protein